MSKTPNACRVFSSGRKGVGGRQAFLLPPGFKKLIICKFNLIKYCVPLKLLCFGFNKARDEWILYNINNFYVLIIHYI